MTKFDLGRAVLYLGDALELLAMIDLSMVSTCITDPPYDINANGGEQMKFKRPYLDHIDGFTDCGFDASILDRFPNWVCFCSVKQIPNLIAQAGNRSWMLITWTKPNPPPFINGHYLPDTEHAIHAWSRGAIHGTISDRSRFYHASNSTKVTDHPNEKPLELILRLVAVSTPPNGIVLDPFMGTGTTGVAAIRRGRRFIGIERVKEHFQTALDRIRTELLEPDLWRNRVDVQQVLFSERDENNGDNASQPTA